MSEARLYPGLKSNNMLGSYEFLGLPMNEKVYGVEQLGHIPRAVLHRYLTDFAKHYRIYERLQFKSAVSLVESTESGWTLTVATPEAERKVYTTKLILATGLTSTPNMPQYLGTEKFERPLFHAKDFCRRVEELKGFKNVVVVGGAKSAYDVAHAMVESGATVDLVIKKDDTGPVWIAPRHVTSLNIASIRFSMCGHYRGLVHVRGATKMDAELCGGFSSGRLLGGCLSRGSGAVSYTIP
jgi:cation diffusion facilitator CzcD-associated flavoprotein CzcO